MWLVLWLPSCLLAASFESSTLPAFPLYTSRFSVRNCGRSSWQLYTEQLEAFQREGKPMGESNFDRLLELLTIRLPVDAAEGRKAYHHKLWSLSRLVHPDTLTMTQWDSVRATAVLHLINVNLFAFLDDEYGGAFAEPLSPESSYLTYEEPAMDMLKLVYGLLNYLLKGAKPGSDLWKAILEANYEQRVKMNSLLYSCFNCCTVQHQRRGCTQF